MKNQIILLFLISLLIKIFIAILAPLAPDEAYYWVWGHHLQLSYFDHPPFVSWLFWLGSFIDIFAGMARLPSVILLHFSLIPWLLFLKNYLNEKQLFWWLALILTCPLTGPGSVIVTPDAPLLSFWGLSFLMAHRYFRKQSLVNCLLLGMSLGLAFLSKYHAVLLAPIFLFWAFSEKINFWKCCKDVGICLFATIIVASPVLIWNYDNNFSSFLFQLNHGLGKSSWVPSWTLQFLIGQILLIFPYIFYRLIKNSKSAPRELVFAAWFPLLFFFLTSFKGKVEANWTIVAYPLILAVVVYKNYLFKWCKLMVCAWLATLAIGLFLVGNPHIQPFEKPLKTHELFKYQPIIHYIKKHQLENVYARTYQMAGKLSYELKKMIYKLNGMNRIDFYDFQPESHPKGDRFFLFVQDADSLPIWLRLSYREVRQVPVHGKFALIEFERL